MDLLSCSFDLANPPLLESRATILAVDFKRDELIESCTKVREDKVHIMDVGICNAYRQLDSGLVRQIYFDYV